MELQQFYLFIFLKSHVGKLSWIEQLLNLSMIKYVDLLVEDSPQLHPRFPLFQEGKIMADRIDL